MASPVLTPSTFDLYDYGSEDSSDSQAKMTVSGAALKAIVCSLIVLAVSLIVHKTAFAQIGSVFAALVPLLLVTAGCCRFLHFNPQKANILAPVFSVIQGITLGLLAKTPLAGILPFLFTAMIFEEDTVDVMSVFEFDQCYFGEVFFSSACIIIVMSLACILGISKAKSSAALISAGDILAVLLFYLAALLAAVLGFSLIDGHSTPERYFLCCAISMLLCLPVAFCLALDFDSIRVGTLSKVPHYMEWYCAFALVFTLTWSYIEIIRLLFAVIREVFCGSRNSRGW